MTVVDHDDLTILSVSAAAIGGGAERVAVMLHERYLERCLDSWLAVGNLNAEVPRGIQIPRDAGRSWWARALLAPAWSLLDRPEGTGAAGRVAALALRVAAEPGRSVRIARGHEDFDFPRTAALIELPPRPRTSCTCTTCMAATSTSGLCLR